jgi:hypothetical protein
MDMDDPWGSPWADEIQHPVIATKEKDNGEVRPKTPVKASTLGLEVKTNSPWDDGDDGFGEWAAVPTGEEVRENGLGFDGAGDAWETRDSGDNRGEAKGNFNGLAESWNDNTNLSDDDIPQLGPSLQEKSAELVRQPSPDPWATETTLDDRHHGEETAHSGQNRHDVEDGADNLVGEIPHGAVVDGAATHEEPLREPPEAIPDENGTTDERDLAKPISFEQEIVPEPAEAVDETVNDHEAGHHSSRPSSSPSDQSHHDILPESPRTSLDEEPKRPQAPRKVSSKIQELVEHFDGLAKQEEELVMDPSRSRSLSKTPLGETEEILEASEERRLEEEKAEAEDDDEDDDFGDFEGGQSEVDASIEEEEGKRPVTPTPTQSQIGSSPAPKMASPQTQISPPRSLYVQKDYGRVEFAIEASTLNKINSPSSGDTTADIPVEKVFIMDTLPYDSFASAEERKTWYRISRYGSMRKHNSGDDENYKGVNWAQSQIRDQTLKTVARWMEEDRISGRVVLGGGNKGSSIFGWNDANAPAVPLDSVFATKRGKKILPTKANVEAAPEVPREWPKGLVRDRSTSKGYSPTKARRRSSAKSSGTSESHKMSPQVPVANFGWNASPTAKSQSPIPLSKEVPKATAAVIKLPSPSRQPRSSDPRQTTSAIVMPAETMQAQKPVDANRPDSLLTSKPAIPVLPLTLPTNSNEGDDWGEMMSSPVVAIPPVLPPSQGMRHKKSQSMSRDFSPPLQASPIDSPIALPQPRRGHRSTTSFDDTVVPEPRVSFDSRSDSLPSNAFTTTSSSSFSNPILQAPPAPTTSVNTHSDPWASADFSFFESPAPAPAQKPTPAVVVAAKPLVLKSVSFAKVPPAPSPLRHGKSRQEIERDEIVTGIVRSLPDLSYMLRR